MKKTSIIFFSIISAIYILIVLIGIGKMFGNNNQYSGLEPAEPSVSAVSPTNTESLTIAPTATSTPIPTNTPTPTLTPTPSPTPSPSPTPTPSPTPIAEINDLVKAALLVKCDKEEVIYAYQEKEQITPASITKLMTALLALEQGNLEDYLSVTETALDVGHPDAAKCGLKLGDNITLKNALYGLLLPSGNEAAEVIGEYISGDVDSFVSLMNQRAVELGMNHTCFKNPHGLPCDGHLTSAWDIYLLMNELRVHDSFFDIANNASYSVTCLDKNGKEKTLEMKNRNLYYQGQKTVPKGIVLVGGKTGYTELAGSCLVLFVKNSEDELYIAELFGAGSPDDLYSAMNHLLELITEI